MSNKIIPIIIQKETVSDDLCTIIELLYKDGDKVEKGDIIITFETSKAVIEIESPSPGYIYYNSKEEQEIPVGAICAAISSFPHISDDYFNKAGTESVNAVEECTTASVTNDIDVSNAAKKM